MFQLELYSSSSSEVSSERQTDCSYYTDTSLALTPPPRPRPRHLPLPDAAPAPGLRERVLHAAGAGDQRLSSASNALLLPRD